MIATPLLAIDPGAQGGLAVLDAHGVVRAFPMPEGMTAQVDLLRALSAEMGPLRALVEKVGYWMPGDHPNSAAKFARHCGHLEAALYALGIPFEEVAPGVWQRALGTLPKDKPTRKRAIRELMARAHPHLNVTLKTADALAILAYATRKGAHP